MGDRKGLFMTLKQYLGNKINGGDRQNGVTWGQTDKLTERREDGGDKGHRQVWPMCLPEQTKKPRECAGC